MTKRMTDSAYLDKAFASIIGDILALQSRLAILKRTGRLVLSTEDQIILDHLLERSATRLGDAYKLIFPSDEPQPDTQHIPEPIELDPEPAVFSAKILQFRRD